LRTPQKAVFFKKIRPPDGGIVVPAADIQQTFSVFRISKNTVFSWGYRPVLVFISAYASMVGSSAK
jgi:hypothetical protein